MNIYCFLNSICTCLNCSPSRKKREGGRWRRPKTGAFQEYFGKVFRRQDAGGRSQVLVQLLCLSEPAETEVSNEEAALIGWRRECCRRGTVTTQPGTRGGWGAGGTTPFLHEQQYEIFCKKFYFNFLFLHTSFAYFFNIQQ